MQERIVELRNILGLTQQEMADGIGIKRGTIANYEVGRNEPPESVRRIICDQYGVNRKWLDTGEGEIFSQKGRSEMVQKMAYRLIVDDSNSFTHSHGEIMERYGSAVVIREEMPPVDWPSMGRYVYIARFKKKEEMEQYFAFVLG